MYLTLLYEFKPIHKMEKLFFFNLPGKENSSRVKLLFPPHSWFKNIVQLWISCRKSHPGKILSGVCVCVCVCVHYGKAQNEMIQYTHKLWATLIHRRVLLYFFYGITVVEGAQTMFIIIVTLLFVFLVRLSPGHSTVTLCLHAHLVSSSSNIHFLDFKFIYGSCEESEGLQVQVNNETKEIRIRKQQGLKGIRHQSKYADRRGKKMILRMSDRDPYVRPGLSRRRSL